MSPDTGIVCHLKGRFGSVCYLKRGLVFKTLELKGKRRKRQAIRKEEGGGGEEKYIKGILVFLIFVSEYQKALVEEEDCD